MDKDASSQLTCLPELREEAKGNAFEKGVCTEGENKDDSSRLAHRWLGSSDFFLTGSLSLSSVSCICATHSRHVWSLAIIIHGLHFRRLHRVDRLGFELIIAFIMFSLISMTVFDSASLGNDAVDAQDEHVAGEKADVRQGEWTLNPFFCRPLEVDFGSFWHHVYKGHGEEDSS